ncbi:PAS domain-containing protein [Clostridia bacterium]|nr:PAS domain-containing protein [Clostridia bacterium]
MSSEPKKSPKMQELQNENQKLKQEILNLTDQMKHLEEENTTAFIIGDAIVDGICVVNASGVVTSINRGYTEITEITEEEIVGKTIPEMLEKNYFSHAVSMEVIEKKQKVSAMATITKNQRQVLLVGTPFLDDSGEVTKVITVMRNLTELVKLREELVAAEQKKNKYKAELRNLKMDRQENSFIGSTPAILKVKELVDHVAGTDATVLITGETGTGKEIVAREILKKSTRNKGPYVKVNCSAIPENLLESELFGYVKGAFTGADTKDKKGLFEIANDGTILLDEISEMPLLLQTKILRVLQEREITRVGGTESIRINVRVISSTNKNLEEMIREKLFRSDLYYRLNVFPIKLPPLREREDDIPDLAAAFLLKYNRAYGRNKSFDRTALATLKSYGWPGNVRELENVVERLVIIPTSEKLTSESVENILMIDRTETDGIGTLISQNISLKNAVAAYEKRILQKALEEYGNTYAVAEILKTTQPTIVRKAHALGIPLKRK